jgi:hypothetical protein
MRLLLFTLCAGLALPAMAEAQVDCTEGNLPHNSNEAKIFKTMAVPLAYDAARAPIPPRPGSVGIALDATYIPQLTAEERTPTYCRPGKGPDNTNLRTWSVRPRILLNGAQGFFLELSYIPPIRVNDVKASVFAIAAGRAVYGRKTAIQLRGYYQVGTIHGPVSCDQNAVNDPASECFGLPVSDDSYKPNQFGFEGSMGLRLGSGRLMPYAGFGVNFLRPRFQVTSTGQKIELNVTRTAVLGGFGLQVTRSFQINAEAYADPAEAVTGRVLVSYAFGGSSGKRRK